MKVICSNLQKEDAEATKRRMLTQAGNKNLSQQQGPRAGASDAQKKLVPIVIMPKPSLIQPAPPRPPSVSAGGSQPESASVVSTPPSPDPTVEDLTEEDDSTSTSGIWFTDETQDEREEFNDRLRLVKTLCIIDKKEMGPIERTFSELKTKLCNSPTYEEVSMKPEMWFSARCPVQM